VSSSSEKLEEKVLGGWGGGKQGIGFSSREGVRGKEMIKTKERTAHEMSTGTGIRTTPFRGKGGNGAIKPNTLTKGRRKLKSTILNSRGVRASTGAKGPYERSERQDDEIFYKERGDAAYRRFRSSIFTRANQKGWE